MRNNLIIVILKRILLREQKIQNTIENENHRIIWKIEKIQNMIGLGGLGAGRVPLRCRSTIGVCRLSHSASKVVRVFE